MRPLKWLGGKVETYFAVFILLLVLMVYLDSRKISELKKNVQTLMVELSAQRDSVIMLRDHNGELYGRIQSTEIDRGILKTSLEAMDILVAELRAKDIAWRRTVEALKLEISSQGRDTITLHDSIVAGVPDKVQTFNWTNHYLSLSGLIKDRHLEMDYYYKTGLTSVTEKKGKEYVVTVSLSDPNARILTGQQIRVHPRAKWWERPWIWGMAGLGIGLWIGK